MSVAATRGSSQATQEGEFRDPLHLPRAGQGIPIEALEHRFPPRDDERILGIRRVFPGDLQERPLDLQRRPQAAIAEGQPLRQRQVPGDVLNRGDGVIEREGSLVLTIGRRRVVSSPTSASM